MASITRKIDVQIQGANGFYQFSLLTRKAQTWTRRHVSAITRDGNDRTFYCDDTRYAMDIAAGMVDAGLTVR